MMKQKKKRGGREPGAGGSLILHVARLYQTESVMVLRKVLGLSQEDGNTTQERSIGLHHLFDLRHLPTNPTVKMETAK
jgi:hypothetical protein